MIGSIFARAPNALTDPPPLLMGEGDFTQLTPGPAPYGRGIFDQLRDRINQPGMKAALLRGAAGALNGGLAGDIDTASGYMDQRDAQDRAQQQLGVENAMKGRGLDIQQQNADTDQTYRNTLGQSDLMQRVIQAAQAAANGRHLDRSDATTAQNSAWEHGDRVRGQDIGAGTADANRQQDDINNQRTTGASIYGANIGYAGRTAAGIGSKAPYGTTKTTTKNPATSTGGFMGIGGTPIPASTTTVEVPNAVPAPAAAAIPPDAVAALKANPGLRPQFEMKYGPGSASRFLGGR